MPQPCKKPHKPQLVPLSLPTSQLRRGISDLEEELDILPREVPQGLKLFGPGQRLQLMLNCNSTLLRFYSKPPKPLPPPLYSSTRRKVKRSGSCKVVPPLFFAATIHAGVFFFTRKFFTMAPALVRATGQAPPRKPKKNNEPRRYSLHRNLCALPKPWYRAGCCPSGCAFCCSCSCAGHAQTQSPGACVQTVLARAATLDGQMSVQSFGKKGWVFRYWAWLCMAGKLSVAVVSTRRPRLALQRTWAVDVASWSTSWQSRNRN